MINRALLDKYRKGACTPQEAARMKAYLEQTGAAAAFPWWQEEWEDTDTEGADIEPGLEEQVWKRIARTTGSTGDQGAKVRRLQTNWRAAAAIAVLVVAGLGLWITNSNGFGQGTGRQLVNRSSKVKMMVLADNSRVWLNPQSSLTYDADFGGSERKVLLKGEAFFEIQPDPDKPFLVETDQLTTRVLGTAFNVIAREGSDRTEVTLVEGKVAIETKQGDTLSMQPGEIVRYLAAEQKIQLQVLPEQQSLVQKTNMIYFDKADISEVTEVLSKWYEVDFVMDDTTAFRTKLVHRIDTKKYDVGEALMLIQRVTDYTFLQQSKNTYKVIPKRKEK